jgi:ribosomal protein S18 acetylase RimI-like enzyme
LPGKEETTRFRFEPLGPAHDRAAFSCGVDALDNYLRRQVGQDVRRRVALAFVLTPDGETVAGYYTLSQYAVELDAIPEALAAKLPKYPFVPATLIGRLAVSRRFRGQGLGELLLMDALKRCLSGSKQVASAAVIVDAKDDRAAAFYKKYGFIELPKIPKRLFLPMPTVERLFSGASVAQTCFPRSAVLGRQRPKSRRP